jgi:hypothetical protein
MLCKHGAEPEPTGVVVADSLLRQQMHTLTILEFYRLFYLVAKHSFLSSFLYPFLLPASHLTLHFSLYSV